MRLTSASPLMLPHAAASGRGASQGARCRPAQHQGAAAAFLPVLLCSPSLGEWCCPAAWHLVGAHVATAAAWACVHL